jgi:hypothetical protein
VWHQVKKDFGMNASIKSALKTFEIVTYLVKEFFYKMSYPYPAHSFTIPRTSISYPIANYAALKNLVYKL